MNTENNDLLLAGEVSRQLRMPLSTLYRLSKKGIIKSIKAGKQWRYYKKDVEEFLSGHKGRCDRKNIQDAEERREFPRINCHIPCDLKIDLPDKVSQTGIIQNISAIGIYVQGVSAKIDDPVSALLCLRGAVKVQVAGRVVRTQDNGFAVKYRNIPEDIKEEIIRYVG